MLPGFPNLELLITVARLLKMVCPTMLLIVAHAIAYTAYGCVGSGRRVACGSGGVVAPGRGLPVQ